MTNNIFLIKRNGTLFAILVAIGFHYLFNPSESLVAQLAAILVRLVSAAVVSILIFAISRPKKNSTKLVYAFYFISIWFLLINFPNNTSTLVLLFSFIGFGFLISAHLAADAGVGIISKSFDFLLAFWVLSLFLQVFIYFLTSEVIDFHQWLHPLSEARITNVGSFVRFTGVLIEPCTYANWVYGLVLLRALSGGKLFDPLSLVAVLSILVTLSAWGASVVGIYLISYFVRNITLGKTRVYRRAVAVIFVLLIIFSVIYSNFTVEFAEAIQYFEGRSELSDASGFAKLQAYQGFFNVFLRIFLVGLPVNYDFCGGCLSSQDAGIFVNMAVRAGIMFTGLVFLIIIKCFFRRYGAIACICIFPLVFAKYFYFEPLFWVIFGCCFLDIFRESKILSRNLPHSDNVFRELGPHSLSHSLNNISGPKINRPID